MGDLVGLGVGAALVVKVTWRLLLVTEAVVLTVTVVPETETTVVESAMP